MDLYKMMQNIRGYNYEEYLIISIENVKKALEGLTEERMCKIYSGFLFEELKKNHVPVRIINTFELGVDYEHFFLVIPSNKEDEKYFIADLTFSQFNVEDEIFKDLINKGYQLVDDDLFNFYLKNIAKNQTLNYVHIADAFFLLDQTKKI